MNNHLKIQCHCSPRELGIRKGDTSDHLLVGSKQVITTDINKSPQIMTLTGPW